MPGQEDSLLFHPLEDEAQNQGPVIGQRAGWVHPHRCFTGNTLHRTKREQVGKMGKTGQRAETL